MLIRFTCENFKSFRDRTEFSMIAGKDTGHEDHLAKIQNGVNVLCGSYIFGANAAGKSNFIRALNFARNIVSKGELDSTDFSSDKFLLCCKNKENNVGFFQFDIFVNKKFYSYGFSLNYITREIEREWLYMLNKNNKETCIFSRLKEEKDQTLITTYCQIDSEIKLKKEEKELFNFYKNDFSNFGFLNSFFLHYVAKRYRPNDPKHFSNKFYDVFQWLSRLLIIFPETHYSGIPSYSTSDDARKTFSDWLKHFDTGIEKLSVLKIPTEKFFENIPEEIRENLRSDILSSLSKSSNQKIFLNNNGKMYQIYYENDKIIVNKIVAFHGDSDVPFDLQDESDGTRRLFDFLPLLQFLKKTAGRVIIVDELDRSLHTKATLEFVRMFYSMNKRHNSQLIVTTHDDDLLNADVIRHDEIWFVERDKENVSHLYPLSDYKKICKESLRKDYLLGRYGALPVFNDLFENNENRGLSK